MLSRNCSAYSNSSRRKSDDMVDEQEQREKMREGSPVLKCFILKFCFEHFHEQLTSSSLWLACLGPWYFSLRALLPQKNWVLQQGKSCICVLHSQLCLSNSSLRNWACPFRNSDAESEGMYDLWSCRYQDHKRQLRLLLLLTNTTRWHACLVDWKHWYKEAEVAVLCGKMSR